MPRVTELVGWGFAVNDARLPVYDQNGQPVANGGGQPKTQPGKLLVLVDPRTGDQVRVGLSLEARDRLVSGLTGGVVVPEMKLVRQ